MRRESTFDPRPKSKVFFKNVEFFLALFFETMFFFGRRRQRCVSGKHLGSGKEWKPNPFFLTLTFNAKGATHAYEKSSQEGHEEDREEGRQEGGEEESEETSAT
jgi:hypothetical protein